MEVIGNHCKSIHSAGIVASGGVFIAGRLREHRRREIRDCKPGSPAIQRREKWRVSGEESGSNKGLVLFVFKIGFKNYVCMPIGII